MTLYIHLFKHEFIFPGGRFEREDREVKEKRHREGEYDVQIIKKGRRKKAQT